MSRPSFQFYHGDWFTNAKLRFCTKDEKGHWIDIMCVMADADEFGVLRRPLKDICEAVGGKIASVRALVDKGVLKGAEKGQRCTAYIYTPRSGRKDGVPVVLIPEQDGPIWYSSKMVRDDYIAKVRAEFARTKALEGATPKHAPKPGIGAAPNPGQSAVPPTPSPSPPPGFQPVSSEPAKKRRRSKPPAQWNGEMVCMLPIVGSDAAEIAITREFVDEMQKAYPNVDCEATLAEIRGWCLANPSRRKTAGGAHSFVQKWFAREQNRG